MFKATVEFSVEGHHHSYRDFEAPDIDSLIYVIDAHVVEFWNIVRNSAERNDGRLVGYCPSYANGVPYFDEENSVEVSIAKLTDKGHELNWNDWAYNQLRDQFHKG